MSRTFPVSVSDDELRQAVVEWSELLAAKKWDEALALFELPSGPYSEEWTPEVLARVIANYGSPDPFPDGRTYELTSLYSLPNVDVAEYAARHIDVDRENLYGMDPERYAGMIHYDGVPLDGEPSDLTARFNIRKAGADQITLEFEDIHVM